MSDYPMINTWMGKPITAENFSKEELVAMIDRLLKERDDAQRRHAQSIEMQRVFATAPTR